jgi:hypothetical protein
MPYLQLDVNGRYTVDEKKNVWRGRCAKPTRR